MRLRALRPAFLVFVLLAGAGTLSAQEQKGPAGTHVLLPSSGFQGGLITGVVLGDDDQPVANAPVSITGGVPALLSGEVIGDEPPQDQCGRNPGPAGTPGGKNPGPQGTDCAQQVTKQPGPPGTAALPPLAKPQDCAAVLSQAAGIVGRNQGADRILIGLSQPSTAGAVGPAETNGAYLNAAGGGIRTDAQGRFAYCARSDAKQTQVALGDGSVRTAVALSAGPNPSCRKTPSDFFMPDGTVDLCQPATSGAILQGGRKWRLPAARAFSSGGDRAITTFKMPRDLGPGRAILLFTDEHGAPQSFTGGVFRIVRASLDVNKLRSHQATDFDYEITLAGFGPASGQNQFGPEYGKNLCVRVTTQGPVALTQAPESRLAVNGDGHAMVRGQIRATEVAPGSAVPFGIALHVAGCDGNVAGLPPDPHATLARLQPSARAWMEQTARRLAGDRSAPQLGELRQAVAQRFPSAGQLEIDYAVLLVAQLTAADQAEDLKRMFDQLKELNKEKQHLRALLEGVQNERMHAPSSAPCLTTGCAAIARYFHMQQMTYTKLQQKNPELQRDADRAQQAEDQQQRDTQNAQDHYDKVMEAISELLQNTAETDDSILAHLP